MAHKEKCIPDENNEYACGFCAFKIVDQDGVPRHRNCCSIEAPWHLIAPARDADLHEHNVVFQSGCCASPLFGIILTAEAEDYLVGHWWVGGDNPCRANHLCALTPQPCRELLAESKCDTSGMCICHAQAVVPFAGLDSVPGALENRKTASVRLTLEPCRNGGCRIVGVVVEMPFAWWCDWKAYRLSVSQSDKLWPRETSRAAGASISSNGGAGDVDESDMGALPYGGLATSSYDDSGPEGLPCNIL